MSNKSVAVAVLLYGDFLQLAQRCLSSIAPVLTDNTSLLIGMNAVSPATRQYVYDTYGDTAFIFDSVTNIRKYPMMRHMFYDAEWGANRSDYVMWFDDDSFIKPAARTGTFINDIVNELETAGDILGREYRIKLQGQQHTWVTQQEWYTASPAITEKASVGFLTGGWWVVKTSVIQKLNYPWETLTHNGGDVMLGIACQQAGYKLVQHKANTVAVNADVNGVESRAKRRGLSEPPVGKYAGAAIMNAGTTPVADMVTVITDTGLI